MLFLLPISIFSKTLGTGDTFKYILDSYGAVTYHRPIPLGAGRLSFGRGDNSSDSYAVVSAIYKYNDVWCIEITYPQIAGASSDTAYSVIYKYFVNIGDAFFMKAEGVKEDIVFEYTVTDIGYNWVN